MDILERRKTFCKGKPISVRRIPLPRSLPKSTDYTFLFHRCNFLVLFLNKPVHQLIPFHCNCLPILEKCAKSPKYDKKNTPLIGDRNRFQAQIGQ